jgi:DNA-binding response OmpR family regulator
VFKLVSQILLIENDPVHGEIARKAFTNSGAELTIVEGTKRALATLDWQPDRLPHLIMLHLGSCENDEFEILFRLRSEKLTQMIPVLVLSETIQKKEWLEHYRFPLCACSVAPFSMTKLIYALPALGMRISDSILYSEQKLRSAASSEEH